MTRIILPFISFAGMLSGGSAEGISCKPFNTVISCSDVPGCTWKRIDEDPLGENFVYICTGTSTISSCGDISTVSVCTRVPNCYWYLYINGRKCRGVLGYDDQPSPLPTAQTARPSTVCFGLRHSESECKENPSYFWAPESGRRRCYDHSNEGESQMYEFERITPILNDQHEGRE